MMWSKIILSFITATLLLEIVSSSLHSSNNISYSILNRRRRQNSELKCTLPSQPDNGEYKVTGGNIINGRALVINLQYRCNPTYALVGDAGAFCYDGEWTPEELPKCVQTCRLIKHRSVIYNCLISGTDATRACKYFEPVGTVVQPVCKQPHYYTPIELPYIHCREGGWNAWPTCMPECGLLKPKAGAEVSPRPGLPWQAAIYYKNIIAATHEHICSGALISNSVVVSAAHCFWNEGAKKIRDETDYAVAVGKLYSDWSHPDDEQYEQKSDVKKIVVPKEYRGDETHHQDDIAVLVVARSFEYQHHVRPVCLDFKQDLHNKQLVSGSIGKSTGFGLSSSNEVSTRKTLQVFDMPFVSHDDCVTRSSNSDKLCAGNVNGPGLCGADSGSGITFPATVQNTTRYYLRGIASVTSNATVRCRTYTTFTSIMKYQNLIKTYWFL